MRFNSVKGGDFTSGAKAVTRNFDAFLDTSVKSAPDFTKISLAAQKGRSVERQAAKKAAGGVKLADIRADSKEKIYDIAYNSDKKVADIKRPAQRMAGIVGGLGALSGYALMAKNAKEEREADERMEALYDQRTKKMTAAIEASKPEPFVPGTYEGAPYKPLPSSEDPAPSSNNDVGSVVEQPMAKSLYNHYIGKGLSRNQSLGLVINAQRESSFSPTVLGDGGHSQGLYQWNGPRRKQMRTSLGKNWGDWRSQANYALNEPGMESIMDTYLNTKWNSPQEAGAYFTRKWERPAHPDDDINRQNGFLSTYDF